MLKQAKTSKYAKTWLLKHAKTKDRAKTQMGETQNALKLKMR